MPARLAIITLIMLALTGCQPTGTVSGTDSFIEVSGTGEVQVVPDVFPVRAEFVRTGKDVAAMKSSLDQTLASLMDTLESLGVPATDMRASDLQVRPEWQWQPEKRLLGQRVSRSLEVRLHGMALYTEVLGVLSQAQPEQLQPLGSQVSDSTGARHEALTLALRDARARAQVLAEEAGRKLGTVVFITEQGQQSGRPSPMMAMEAASTGPAYSAGEQSISATVMARFKLD